MPVRLRDLARQVGVHPSTVSRVLSGDPAARLADTTRTRILRAAHETDYRPNRLARSLKVRRTRLLGMLIPDVTNPFFSALFRAVEDAAGEAGYNVILCNTDDSPARLDQHLRALGEGHVDGVLVAAAHLHDARIADLAARGTLPYVLVNRHRGAGDACVVSEDAGGARLIVDHLVSLGHTRIAHLTGGSDISTTATRAESFRTALRAHGLEADEALVVHGGLTEESGAAGMRMLLNRAGARGPTAVFAANDLVAIGAIDVAQSRGLRVPEDLAVAGYNDIPAAARAVNGRGLTTVRVPLAEMGRRAAQMLIRRLDGGLDSSAWDGEPTRVVLPVELVIRGSTAGVTSSRSLTTTEETKE